MSKRDNPDVMNYNAIVMRGCERPAQTEMTGADGFNLASETIREYVAPPAADYATGDLFGPVAAWLTKDQAERDAREAKRREADARAEAIRADLAKPKESWTHAALVAQIEAQDVLIVRLREKVRIAEASSNEGKGWDYFQFLAADLTKAMQEREAARAALSRFE
jgi:hypothetical protein